MGGRESVDITVHIGVHRTGTTALQHSLGSAREPLRAVGVDFPTGHVDPDNHLELCFASLRPERLAEAAAFFNYLIRMNAADMPEVDDDSWFALARDLVGDGQTVLSTETLAWIRHDDEVEALVNLLGGRPRIVVAHRNREDFLASYFAMSRLTTLVPPEGPDSIFYTGPDSWLADADARIDLWRRNLGDDRVVPLDYDEVMASASSMTPAVVAAMGLDPMMVADDAETMLNRRSDLPITDA